MLRHTVYRSSGLLATWPHRMLIPQYPRPDTADKRVSHTHGSLHQFSLTRHIQLLLFATNHTLLFAIICVNNLFWLSIFTSFWNPIFIPAVGVPKSILTRIPTLIDRR